MTTTALDSSFVFYQSFFNMIGKIPDGETRLAAYDMICAYALNGMEPQSDNWLLELVFCAVKPLIDKNRKRRENGKKGGRKPQAEAVQEKSAAEMQTEAMTGEGEAAPQAMEIQTEQQVSALKPEQQTVQHRERQVTEAPQAATQPMEQERAIVQSQDEPVLRCEERPYSALQGETSAVQEPESAQIKGEPILHFGKTPYPVLPEELAKIRQFAQEVFKIYWDGRKPNDADVEKVMEYTVIRQEIDEDRAVAVLDEGKADLLWYAFEKASAAQKLSWRYIEGMYRNFLRRDITTGAEAYQYDLLRGTAVS